MTPDADRDHRDDERRAMQAFAMLFLALGVVFAALVLVAVL